MSATPEIPPAAPRSHPGLAWLVILAVVVFIVVRTLQSAPERERHQGEIFLDIQVRYLVGLARFAGGETLYAQAKTTLGRGSYLQRLRLVVLAGELVGPEEA